MDMKLTGVIIQYELDLEGLAEQLYRVSKEGAVVVWVVGDQKSFSFGKVRV